MFTEFKKRAALIAAILLSFTIAESASAIDAAQLAPSGQTPLYASGQQAVIPIAFAMFCRTSSFNCKKVDPAPGFVLNDARLADLQAVNRDINSRITYVADRVAAGVNDQWNVAIRTGDCEDYALTKRQELLDRGWPSDRLLLALARTPEGVGHVVLVVRTDRQDLVLDNMTDEIHPWEKTDLEFLKIQSPIDPMHWVKPVMRG